MSLYYYKDMFKVQDLEQTKNIILTEEQQGGDYRQRWERETEYMKTLFAGGLGDLSGKTVLDFGCGIGRLSKALLEQYDCRVLGVDISPDMRRMAAEYVNSDRFSVISYEMFCCPGRAWRTKGRLRHSSLCPAARLRPGPRHKAAEPGGSR